MSFRSALLVAVGFSALLAAPACATCPPCEQAKAPCAAAGDAPSPAAGPSASAPVAPVAASATQPTAAAGASGSASPQPVAPPPAPSAAAPEPAQALPEVKVENVGLHIGGGPNDDATKAPFQRAIEKHFDELRACYVKVEDPVKGGTFGVDFHIGRDGGKAQVKQPRSGMKGPEFRQCVVSVLESVEFEKPKKGPTVISYSIRYTLLK